MFDLIFRMLEFKFYKFFKVEITATGTDAVKSNTGKNR